MSVEADLGSALSRLPGWEHAVAEEMTGGQTNRSYLLQAGACFAVLKIDAGARAAPFSQRENEAKLQSIAAEHGIAGPVLFAGDNLYLTEYLQGEVWSDAALASDSNLGKLAAAMRTLHGLPLTGRTFDAHQAAVQYARQCDDANADKVRECLRTIESVPPPRRLSCCHNDLVAANIIATPELKFLDWEYACDNDPLFDLATVVAHHRLGEDRANILLDAYFDGDGRHWRESLQEQARLYDALRWLWQAARQPPA